MPAQRYMVVRVHNVCFFVSAGYVFEALSFAEPCLHRAAEAGCFAHVKRVIGNDGQRKRKGFEIGGCDSDGGGSGQDGGHNKPPAQPKALKANGWHKVAVSHQGARKTLRP